MLDSLHIKNFRSCDDVQLRLGEPVVSLVGKNGVGKTNVLHAIQLVADSCVGEADAAFSFSPRDRARPTTFNLAFTIASDSYEYSLSRSGLHSDKENLEENLTRGGHILFTRRGESLETPRGIFAAGLRVAVRTSSVAALMQLLPPDEPMHRDISPVAKYLRAVRYYPLMQGFQEHTSDSIPFIEAARYEAWKSQYLQGKSPKSVMMRILHMHLTAKDKLQELKTILGDGGLGLIADIRVEEIRLQRAGKSEDAAEPAYSVMFVPCAGLAGAGHPFRFSGLSAGTWRVLQLLGYLVFDESSCMLLEQPEDCIHTGLLAKVIDILRTYSTRTQLICTTHSAKVMNLVGASGIRIVAADKGRTDVAELSAAQLEASDTYLADEGTLAEFLETL